MAEFQIPVVPGLKKRQLARWESKTGKHWVTLNKDRLGHTYDAPGAGGSLGKDMSDEEAVSHMQERVDAGHFLPDAAKTPMRRIDMQPVRVLHAQQFGEIY